MRFGRVQDDNLQYAELSPCWAQQGRRPSALRRSTKTSPPYLQAVSRLLRGHSPSALPDSRHPCRYARQDSCHRTPPLCSRKNAVYHNRKVSQHPAGCASLCLKSSSPIPLRRMLSFLKQRGNVILQGSCVRGIYLALRVQAERAFNYSRQPPGRECHVVVHII